MASTLPTGTVTFLFTDVDGSTRLLEELGAEAYGVELGRHREIVRAVLADHGGVEVDTQGDAFFCVFASARSAVACAGEIQSALAAGPILVRIGIHTGEALVVDRHYVGMDVHRAARVGACGHGGQVVLSPSTVGLLDSGEFALHDLGAHRLKDLAAPVVLHQLGDDRFPPLKTLYRTNLPVPATPFLGREEELAELLGEASRPGVRVLTLTGPGGTGKTRLSLQLVAELSDSYPDGVWWIPLAPLRDGALVASAAAGVLEVDEEPGRSLLDSVAGVLAHKRALILLDNCEHLVEAAAELAATVSAGSPETLVVATSREPLAIGGEHLFPVPPLAEDDAVELFHARAWAAGARFDRTTAEEAVSALCTRLDNLPLAVELAAARTPALPPAALLDRLSTRLDVLAGPRDADERQRTLRATIAWSYDLLDEVERRLFRRLAVFVGGASLSAIENVCDADLGDILSLVAKSLLRQAASVESDEPRYFMLETIREFAAEELEASGEVGAQRDRHLEWFSVSLPRAGSDELDALDGEQLARVELDVANLRAALSWSREHHTHAAVALGAVLWHRHTMRGRYAEAEELARSMLEVDLDPLDEALFRHRLAVTLRQVGRPGAALDSYLQAEQILDGVVERDATWWERWIGLKLDQAHFFYFENDQSAHGAVLDELEPVVPTHGTAGQQLDLLHARMQRRYRLERYALSEETERLAREIYELDRANGVVAGNFTLGFCLLWRGKLEDAEAHLERGREDARAAGAAVFETRCLVYGLVVKRRQNDVEAARARLAELEGLDELHGYRGLISACGAWVAYRDGDAELATRHADVALAEWGSEGRLGYGVFQWTARFPLLAVSLIEADFASALEHAQAMLDPRQQPLPDAIAAAVERGVATRRGDDLQAAVDVARPCGYS